MPDASAEPALSLAPQARVVPADPALPALAELFPPVGAPTFVAEAVAQALGVEVDARSAAIGYVRYRPTRSCMVLWSFVTPSGRPLLASARLFRNDRGEKLVHRDDNRQLIDGAAKALDGAQPYRYFAGRRLFLQIFPLDLRLPAVLLATDAAWVRDTFLPAAGVAPDRARVVAAGPATYKPWRRCVYRYTVDVAGDERTYFGKLFRDGRGEQLLAWHRALDAQLTAAGAPWRPPQALAYLPEARTLIFRSAEGGGKVRRLLRPALRESSARTALLGFITRAAQGLAPFQRMAIEGLPDVPPRRVVANFRRHAEGLPDVEPTLAASVAGLLEQLERTAAQLPPEPMVPTHGAFRHDQLLYDEEGLTVLDLDTFCLSGASADAGNFLGYLDLTALRRPRLRPVIEACAQTLTEALQDSGVTSPGWLAWYRAAAHVKKALRSLFSLDPAWPERTDELLHLARETLASAR